MNKFLYLDIYNILILFIINIIGKNKYNDKYNYIISNDGLNDIKNYIISNRKLIILFNNITIIKYYINKILLPKKIIIKNKNVIEYGNTINKAIYDIRDYLLLGYKVYFKRDCELNKIINE